MEFLGLGAFFVCSEVSDMFDKVTIREHFRNLYAKVGDKCMEHLARAQAATQTGDWFVVCAEWISCGDAIVRSSLLDGGDRIWLSGVHALGSANLWAFYRKNLVHALKDAMAASKACDEVQNVPDALDFKSYVEATLLKVMYLWASTSDCEEEALDPDVKAFLIDKVGHAGDSVSDYEVRTLKKQCKKFVINKSESVIWEVQKDYFYHSETEEGLRWAHEGSISYKEKYPDQLDYVSKFNEAFLLYGSEHPEEASKIFAEIIYHLEAESMDGHPAALCCNLQYVYCTHFYQSLCYRRMVAQSGRGEEKANKEEATCASLSAQREYAEMFNVQRDLLREAVKCKAKMWEENYEKSSPFKSKWVHFALSAVLIMLHAEFRTEYRKSYESGKPNEWCFLMAELCSTEVLKKSDSVGPIDSSRIDSFMDLVRLHHEKDREVMFLKQSSSFDVEEIAPILQNAVYATKCYVENLLRRTEYDDYWVVAQKSCSDLYYMIQFHYFAKWIASRACTLPGTCDIKFTARLHQLWNQSLMSKAMSVESSVLQGIWKQSLLWAERRVGKATYFQFSPNMLSTSAVQQLCEFDVNDDVAWKTLKSSRAACGPGTVVLEYFLSEENDLQFVYVLTKDDEVFMQILNVNGRDSVLWKLLKWLRSMASVVHECEGAFINGTVELLHEILISPVANFLDGMEEEDKLIIVAPEILSDVPFAALRKPDSPVGEGYLIQSHTISVTSSLRMLQHCNERLKELVRDVLDTKPGTIVAVGDPAYNKDRLEGCGEEVDFIEKLFGENHVKKLVRSEATPSEVLKWAKYPRENCVKQVIFHIAAHGIGQDNGEVKRGAIVLARPASSCQQNCATAGPGAMARAQGDENFDDDNVHDETELADSSFSMVDVKEDHISSHGEVGGLRTRIVVPISKFEPHILKSENIIGCGFQWKAHMVVLSACDTARGQITGEGVLNLPRALMIAGVPCVVVSQWKVDDSSTFKLMKGFYEHLKSGKDVSSSLRAAMLKMIEEGAKVSEWAPFIVCGLPTVYLPTKLQGETPSCNDQDNGTSSDRKSELRGKKAKVKPVNLTDWQMARFFKGDESTVFMGDESTRCLRCEVELYDDGDAEELKNILARFEKIVHIVNPADEDVKELVRLSAMIKTFNAKHANGGK